MLINLKPIYLSLDKIEQEIGLSALAKQLTELIFRIKLAHVLDCFVGWTPWWSTYFFLNHKIIKHKIIKRFKGLLCSFTYVGSNFMTCPMSLLLASVLTILEACFISNKFSNSNISCFS